MLGVVVDIHWRGCWYSLECLLYQFIVLGVVVDINWSVCCIDLLCLAWLLLAFIDVVVASVCCACRGCCHSLTCLSYRFVVLGVVVELIGVFVVDISKCNVSNVTSMNCELYVHLFVAHRSSSGFRGCLGPVKDNQNRHVLGRI